MKLPDTLKPGEPHEVQLSPFGEFRNYREDDKTGEMVPFTQVCDAPAFNTVVKNFKDEILFDIDHAAELGGSTKAAAWVQSVRVDPTLGLMGTIKLTESGARLVNSREYRFPSPCWETDKPDADQQRPTRLVSVGLTNKPNLPVRPVLNRAPAAASGGVEGGKLKVENLHNPQPKGASNMLEQLKTLLGLPPEATEDQVVAAVKAQGEALAANEAATLNAEAEAAAATHAAAIKNRDDFIKSYKMNREAAKGVLNAMHPPASPVAARQSLALQARVTNSLAARPPETAAVKNALDTYEAMPAGPEKRKYLNSNAAEINRLRVERKKAAE